MSNENNEIVPYQRQSRRPLNPRSSRIQGIISYEDENYPIIEKLKERLNENFKEKLENIVTKLRNLNENDIIARYYVGKEIVEILDNPDVYGRYSERFIIQFIPIQKDTLRHMVMVARRLDEGELKKLLSYKNEITGEGLTWSHLVLLSAIPDDVLLHDFAKTTVKKAWTISDLTYHLKSLYLGNTETKKRAALRGRKHKVPSDIDRLLNDIRNRLSNITKRVIKWEESIQEYENTAHVLMNERKVIQMYEKFIDADHAIMYAIDELDSLRKTMHSKIQELKKYIFDGMKPYAKKLVDVGILEPSQEKSNEAEQLGTGGTDSGNERR